MTKTANTTEVSQLPYIEADTCKGPWTRRARTLRGQNWTAEDLHESLPAGEIVVLWESFGYVNGQERFGRERAIADSNGISVYNSDGGLTLRHPLGKGRIIRILVK